MPAVKECTPAKPVQDLDYLAAIIRYTIPVWQAQKPDSKNTNKADISDKVNANIATLPSNVPTNSSNYGPLTSYGLIPYVISHYSYGLIGSYLDRRIQEMHDFTDRVPGKQLNSFPVSGNEGLFGFTYLGDVHAWRRDDLTGEFAKMVDVHESIHTPDEYETRRITEWMMSKERPKYIK